MGSNRHYHSKRRDKPVKGAGPFGRAALHYHEAGLFVLPVKAGRSGLVQPFFPYADKEHARTRDVQAWIQRYGWADIAIRLGHRSGNLVDIEIDGPNGEATLRELGWNLPDTIRWESRRGPHRLYRSRRPLRGRLTGEFGPGLDVLSDGLTVAPPSRGRVSFASGNLLTITNVEDLPYLPETVERAIIEKTRPTPCRPVIRVTPVHLPHLDSALFPLNLEALRSEREEWIGHLFTRPDVVAAVAHHLGVPSLETGKPFCCVLPGHNERNPSAVLWTDSQDRIVYRDWHKKSGIEWLTLADVYASQCYGRVVKLPGPGWAVWALRLLVDAGVLALPTVEAWPSLPVHALPDERLVWDGFCELLAVKMLWGIAPDTPTAYSARFAAAWCGHGRTYMDAWHAITKLRQWGYLQQVGQAKRAFLYLHDNPGVVTIVDEIRSSLRYFRYPAGGEAVGI